MLRSTYICTCNVLSNKLLINRELNGTCMLSLQHPDWECSVIDEQSMQKCEHHAYSRDLIVDDYKGMA